MSRAALAHAAESAAPTRSSVASSFSASALRINRPGDSYEQEADQAADQVVSNAPASASARKAAWSLSKVSLRAPLERETDEASAPVVAGRIRGVDWSESGAKPSMPNNQGEKQKTGLSVAVDRALRSAGQPLDASARGNFERHFGRDLGGVRLHTDGTAAKAAKGLNAAAFTVGNDIVFAPGRYAPRTAGGRLLLLHELRHVEQQRSATPTPAPEIDPPQSIHEGAARRLLDPHVDSLPLQRIQCAPDDPQFSLGGGAVDTVGKVAFGDSSWPFLKAVFEGFIGGLLTDVKSGRGDQAKDHMSKLLIPWNAAKFYTGYLVGLVVGLVSPITDLVKGVIGIVRLAVSALEWLAKWSPAGVAISPERQQKIARLMQTFSDLATEFGKALMDFASDPKGTVAKFAGFLDNLMQMALGKARELGAKAAHSIFDFLEREYFDMGQGIGEVIGTLIAQILLLVFSDAIGNLVSKGASFLGKAAEFAAGKAVEVFEWVKGLVGEVLTLLRNAVKGALKLFEGLVNKAVEAFDSLAALFTESEALEAGGEKVAAGVGPGVTGPVPNVMESRMVSSTRTAPAKVSDLRPPKVHPSNIEKVPPKRPEIGKAPFDEPLTKSERGLTQERLRQKHILEEQAERQRGARPATKEEATTGQGRREVRTPGKSIPLHLERGQFAHEYAELLIKESELPRGLSAEVAAELPGGRVRLDRVDFEKGVYYEIKPNTIGSQKAGADQIAKYAQYMNENYPLPGGRKWAGCVVTYKTTDAVALFGL
jgi:hypothetical protein